jgi:hypothetical protein
VSSALSLSSSTFSEFIVKFALKHTGTHVRPTGIFTLNMAEGGEPRLKCGRHGCVNVERRSGEFLRCSRCKATFYCSRECQKEDYCKGHSACALKGLLAAAEEGPLTAGGCKQVRCSPSGRLKLHTDKCERLLC